ncbi:NAD(P)-dependent oxidoreductase [Pseudarthrobacter sp. MDT3-28]|uniref:NAD(P)-dependent oxidoreductase n=1 Tax=Pseudarthrobacter raffinosi TaxID=2953651 RepID=UPI00208EF928|nr:NAD(P)-dependent oxidoreductase [Pseudarthrobacter sp. MDT3-28]MCO4239396.1 NAD(P)-dependent oxidoreductase [Pseudarthrobacter sp. MDT3-28]
MSTPQITFIGAGAIGLPMAVRAAAAGAVTAVDTSAERLAEARSHGLQTSESLAATSPADIVLVMVATAQQAAAVLNGPDGVYATADPGAVVVVLSTLGPDAMQKLAAERPAGGPVLLDVPVTGGIPGAVAGTLTLFAAGDPDAIEQIRPVLETMGKVVFSGPNVGDGQSYKIVNQLLATSQLVVAAEALAFAERLGLDTGKVFDAVRGGAGGSWMLENYGPRMLDTNTADIAARVDIFLKDAALVGETAERIGFEGKMATATVAVLERAVALGLAARDASSVIDVYRQK